MLSYKMNFQLQFFLWYNLKGERLFSERVICQLKSLTGDTYRLSRLIVPVKLGNDCTMLAPRMTLKVEKYAKVLEKLTLSIRHLY